jgi:Calpain family cysteine protease
MKQSGSINVFADASGLFNFKVGDADPVQLKYAGQTVSQKLLRDVKMEIESVVAAGGGFKLYVRDQASELFELTLDGAGVINPASFTKMNAAGIQAAEAVAKKDLNGKGDAPAEAGWTSQLKTAEIRTAVESLTAQTAKIDHAGLVQIVNAALGSLSGAASVGANVFSDLGAISSRALSLFSSKDLAGKETGYLQYVFDKLVNGASANSFYTGGATKAAQLGNLSAASSVDVLQKLTNKWLLGLDLPNPNTQGDTANPNATAASGVYQKFSVPLIAGNTAAFDVNQGSAGTCYLLAAIATVAQVNPGSFNSLFVSNGENASGTSTWGVRFFDATGNAHWVTANNQLCVKNLGDEQPAYTKIKGVDAAGNPVVELWAPLVEKAYAQANELGILGRQTTSNAYFSIEGGFSEPIPQVGGGRVFQFGGEAYNVNNNPHLPVVVTPEGTTALAEYTKALNSQKPFFVVSFAITKDAAGNSEFVKGHAYMAIDADLNSSTNTSVKIYNPWGPTGAGFVSPFDADLVTLIGMDGISFWVGA